MDADDVMYIFNYVFVSYPYEGMMSLFFCMGRILT